MYCTTCGIDLGPTAKFCSSCGTSLAAASTTSPIKSRDWDLHINVLGWLVIAHAAMVGFVGLVVMFGGQFVSSLIARSPNLFDHVDPNDVPPPEVLQILAPASFVIGTILLLIALPSIIAGVGLLRYRTWGSTRSVPSSAGVRPIA